MKDAINTAACLLMIIVGIYVVYIICSTVALMTILIHGLLFWILLGCLAVIVLAVVCLIDRVQYGWWRWS